MFLTHVVLMQADKGTGFLTSVYEVREPRSYSDGESVAYL